MGQQTSNGYSATLAQAQWEGPQGQPAHEWLAGDGATLDAGSATPSHRAALEKLGLADGAVVRAQPRLEPPREAYRVDAPDAWGATVAIEVGVSTIDGAVASAISAPVRHADGTLLRVPWPTDAHGNVFADRTGARYCVRTQLVARPGVYVDELAAYDRDTQTGSRHTRELGILSSGNTRRPRVTFTADASLHDGDRDLESMPDLAMQIWPEAVPGRRSPRRPLRTVTGASRILRTVRAAARHASRRRPRRDLFADALSVSPAAARELADLHARAYGADAPARAPAPWITEADVRAIALTLGAISPIAAERGARSLTRMTAQTAVDTLRSALREGVRAALVHVTGADSDPAHPLVAAGEDPGQTAQAIADAMGALGAADRIERAVRSWRETARTVRIEPGTSDAAVEQTARTVILRGQRLSRHTDEISMTSELGAPHMGTLWLDTAAVSHNSQPGRAAPATACARLLASPDGAQRLPALALVENGVETAVPLGALTGQAIALERDGAPPAVVVDGVPAAPGAAARYRLPDAGRALAGPVTRSMPLSALTGPTRAAMAASMGAAAIDGGEPEPHTPLLADPTAEHAAGGRIPSHRVRIALTSGYPELFEDSVMMSRSAALATGLLNRQTQTFYRGTEDDADCEYVAGALARYEEVAADVPFLTRAAYDKLDADGIVRAGVTVEPGDVLQLRRRRDRLRDTVRYEAERAPAHGRHVVEAVERAGEAAETEEALSALDLAAEVEAALEGAPDTRSGPDHPREARREHGDRLDLQAHAPRRDEGPHPGRPRRRDAAQRARTALRRRDQRPLGRGEEGGRERPPRAPPGTPPRDPHRAAAHRARRRRRRRPGRLDRRASNGSPTPCTSPPRTPCPSPRTARSPPA